MGNSGLGKLLVEDGLLTDLDFRTIKRTSGGEGAAFARSVLAIGLLAEDELAAFLAEKTNWNVAPLDLLSVARQDALALVDKMIMQRLEVIPIQLDEGVLHLAVVDPLDMETLSQVAFFTGTKVRPMIATLTSIRKALKSIDPSYRPPRSQLETFMNNHAMAASRQLRIGEGRIVRTERKTVAVRPVTGAVLAGVTRPFANANKAASSDSHHRGDGDRVEHQSMPKADPPIGLVSTQSAHSGIEDLLDEGMHQHSAEPAPMTNAPVDANAAVDAVMGDVGTDAELPAEANAAGADLGEELSSAQDPLAELGDHAVDDFAAEPAPDAGNEFAAAPAQEAGDELIDDSPLPELETPPSAAPEPAASHPSDEQIESLFADENLAELASAPPVDVPESLAEVPDSFEAAAPTDPVSIALEEEQPAGETLSAVADDQRPVDSDDILDDAEDVEDALGADPSEVVAASDDNADVVAASDDLTIDAILDEPAGDSVVESVVEPVELESVDQNLSSEDLLDEPETVSSGDAPAVEATDAIDAMDAIDVIDAFEDRLTEGAVPTADQNPFAEVIASADDVSLDTADVDLSADQDSVQDLTFAAGLNRAVLALSMAQTLNKAIERVASPLHLAGVTQSALIHLENGKSKIVATWQMVDAEPRLTLAGPGQTLDETIENASAKIAEGWTKIPDSAPFSHLDAFANGVKEGAEVYGAVVYGPSSQRVLVVVSSTKPLSSDAAIGVAALDLFRRLAKKI